MCVHWLLKMWCGHLFDLSTWHYKFRISIITDLRKKFRVSFVNAQGLDELGIDGGGLFREFLSEVLKTGFDPNRGYFSTTEDGLIYPNPQVSQ